MEGLIQKVSPFVANFNRNQICGHEGCRLSKQDKARVGV